MRIEQTTKRWVVTPDTPEEHAALTFLFTKLDPALQDYTPPHQDLQASEPCLMSRTQSEDQDRWAREQMQYVVPEKMTSVNE